MAGDTSGKTSRTRADMGSTSAQDVWGPQTSYLQNLYGTGQQLSTDPRYSATAQQLGGATVSPLQQQYAKVFGAGNPYERAATGVTDPLVSGLSDIATTPTGVGSTPLLDKNVAMALEQASQNFNRNILPSLRHDAQSMGQYGGTRGELAEGIAAGDAFDSALRQAMGAYSDQYRTDIQAKSLQDQNRLAATQQMQDILGGYSGTVGAGLGAGEGLYNLGMRTAQAPWEQLGYQSSLLGGPLVLGQTTSTGRSSSDPILTPESIIDTFKPGGILQQSFGDMGGMIPGGGGGAPGGDLNPFNW